jgi:hypothetical protein
MPLFTTTSGLYGGVLWSGELQAGVGLCSTQFPGVLVGPPPVRKCHQMLPKEHMQLGWVVLWVLSTHTPGHPTAGRCGRVVPVPPLLLCTRPARACPSVGGQIPLPLRASSHGVLPGGPNTLSVSSAFSPRLPFRPRGTKSRLCTTACCCALRARPKLLSLLANRSHAQWPI